MEKELEILNKQMKQHNEYMKSIKQTLNIFLFLALVGFFVGIVSFIMYVSTFR